MGAGAVAGHLGRAAGGDAVAAFSAQALPAAAQLPCLDSAGAVPADSLFAAKDKTGSRHHRLGEPDCPAGGADEWRSRDGAGTAFPGRGLAGAVRTAQAGPMAAGNLACGGGSGAGWAGRNLSCHPQKAAALEHRGGGAADKAAALPLPAGAGDAGAGAADALLPARYADADGPVEAVYSAAGGGAGGAAAALCAAA